MARNLIISTYRARLFVLSIDQYNYHETNIEQEPCQRNRRGWHELCYLALIVPALPLHSLPITQNFNNNYPLPLPTAPYIVLMLDCKLCNNTLKLDIEAEDFFYDVYDCLSCKKYSECYKKPGNELIKFSFDLNRYTINVYTEFARTIGIIYSKSVVYRYDESNSLIDYTVIDFELPVNITEDKLKKLMVLK